jgi:hypothetical protein
VEEEEGAEEAQRFDREDLWLPVGKDEEALDRAARPWARRRRARSAAVDEWRDHGQAGAGAGQRAGAVSASSACGGG